VNAPIGAIDGSLLRIFPYDSRNPTRWRPEVTDGGLRP